MVQLTQDLIAKLDEEAAERGMSRSAVIREAIESHIAAREHDAIGRPSLRATAASLPAPRTSGAISSSWPTSPAAKRRNASTRRSGRRGSTRGRRLAGGGWAVPAGIVVRLPAGRPVP